MKKSKTIILAMLSAFLLCGVFTIHAHAQPIVNDAQPVVNDDEVQTRQQIIGERHSFTIVILVRANSATWAEPTARTATANNSLISVHRPPTTDNVMSRIIRGNDASPGLTSTWQLHRGGALSTVTHITQMSGLSVRPQFHNPQPGRPAFTVGGSWVP